MESKGIDAFIFIPQCPQPTWQDFGRYKTTTVIMSVIDGLIAHGSVDKSRIYVSGFSMGANSGVWMLYDEKQNYFAAFAPISGETWPKSKIITGIQKSRLRIAPVWSFNGEFDPGVSADVEATLTSLGSHVHKVSIIKGQDHNGCGEQVYNHNLAFLDWLFAQRNLLYSTDASP